MTDSARNAGTQQNQVQKLGEAISVLEKLNPWLRLRSAPRWRHIEPNAFPFRSRAPEISLAQKARWAKIREVEESSLTAGRGRRLREILARDLSPPIFLPRRPARESVARAAARLSAEALKAALHFIAAVNRCAIQRPRSRSRPSASSKAALIRTPLLLRTSSRGLRRVRARCCRQKPWRLEQHEGFIEVVERVVNAGEAGIHTDA